MAVKALLLVLYGELQFSFKFIIIIIIIIIIITLVLHDSENCVYHVG